METKRIEIEKMVFFTCLFMEGPDQFSDSKKHA